MLKHYMTVCRKCQYYLWTWLFRHHWAVYWSPWSYLSRICY